MGHTQEGARTKCKSHPIDFCNNSDTILSAVSHRSGARASGVKALYLARLAGLKEEKDLEKNIQTGMDGVWLKVPAVKAWVLASIVPS